MAIDKNEDYIEWDFTYDFSYLDPPLQETIGAHIAHSRSVQKSWTNTASKKATLSGPEAITLHWTATYNIENAINVLRSRKVGYNFVIDINGTIVQTLSVNRRANHAGTSWGPRGNTWTSSGCLNDYSIGISFVFTPEKQYEKYFIHDAGEIQKIKYTFQWKHLLPSKEYGFVIRYLVYHNKDPKIISENIISLFKTMKSHKNIEFFTYNKMIALLDNNGAL